MKLIIYHVHMNLQIACHSARADNVSQIQNLKTTRMRGKAQPDGRPAL